MMPTDAPYLLDTATTTLLMRANAPTPLRSRVRRARHGSIWMSALTEGQLRRQLHLEEASAHRDQALELLLRNVPTLPFDRAAAAEYARLPRLLDPPSPLTEIDLMVAAHALSIEAVLITADETYDRIRGLATANWLVD